MNKEGSVEAFQPLGPGGARDIVPSMASCQLVLVGSHKGLLRVKTWVEQHGALTLTLLQAADLACLTPHHFSAAFHKHTGETFKKWRRRIRICWAVGAIESGQHSINEVMHLAGYQDRRAFERAIKQLTGTTPGCIRRNIEGSIVCVSGATKNRK